MNSPLSPRLLIPSLEPDLEPAPASGLEASLKPPAAALSQAQADPSAVPTNREGIDLARMLIRDPAHTLLLRVAGDSMQGAGIRHGDLLVVDRAREPTAGSIVVARFGGQFTLKRLCQSQGRRWLEAAHPDYPPIALEPPAGQGEPPDDSAVGSSAAPWADGCEVQLWGVAVHVIHPL